MELNQVDKMMMETAKLWSNMSKCKRHKVGAVISKDSRIISIGYNGNPSGHKPIKKEVKCELCNGTGKLEVMNELPLDDVYGFSQNDICPKCGGVGNILIEKDECENDDNITINSVIHAEANAILFCAKNGISTEGTTLYVTMSPCYECSKMIVQSGIKRVVYSYEYRDTTSIDFLKECDIDVVKL